MRLSLIPPIRNISPFRVAGGREVQDKMPLFVAVKVSFRVVLEEIINNAANVCFKVVS